MIVKLFDKFVCKKCLKDRKIYILNGRDGGTKMVMYDTITKMREEAELK